MEKNSTWKIVLIVVLTAVAIWTLYPPDERLKGGIDLVGGTSLIYEIDTQELEGAETRDLSGKMITVLRRRIDPANIQNLIWRPQGNTRFEIQMPLSSPKSREKRQYFDQKLTELLAQNVNPAMILRSLREEGEQRDKDFEKFAEGSLQKQQILSELAAAYEQRQGLRTQRDGLVNQLKMAESAIGMTGLNLDEIKSLRNDWVLLNDEELKKAVIEFIGSDRNADLLSKYVSAYSRWADIVDKLTDQETGQNVLFEKAKRSLSKLSLTKEQMELVLDLPEESPKRIRLVEELKTEFADREELIDEVIIAFDQYRPFRGRLDDPKDLQRMLKGAGVLGFRILPTTTDGGKLSSDKIEAYKETLREKGPKFASDVQYIWCEIEDFEKWKTSDSVVAEFGNKHYVLASNKKDETLLNNPEKPWKLKRASVGRDRMGRMAIDFMLDDRGGAKFSKITGGNIDNPLCILLDGFALSAPNIQSRIYNRGQITGSFLKQEVDDMVLKLNAGTLPGMLIEQPISVKSIGPLIGTDNRDKGIYSAIVGFAAVTACMLIYYLLAGAIANVALLLNMLFILATMVFLRATFTLPGIAGLILTIGMSVDANVLIFERIREEQDKGSTLAIAIKNGYQRALHTIVDANITTFITAAILRWVAPEEVRGFAIVLMIGIVSSMFTALFVTRIIFNLLVKWKMLKNRLVMLRLIHKPNINWMAARPVFLTVSALLMIGSLVVFFTRDDAKNNKFDIEFTGGTSVRVSLKDPADIQQVRDKFYEVAEQMQNRALQSASIYSVGKSNTQYEIMTTETNKTTAQLNFPSAESAAKTADEVVRVIKKADARITNLVVTMTGDGEFIIETGNTNKSLVESVLSQAFDSVEISQLQVEKTVEGAIIKAFGDELEIRRSLRPEIVSQEKITSELIESFPELTDFVGGVKITCRLGLPAALSQLQARLADLRFKPDMQDLAIYPYRILGPQLEEVEADKAIDTFVYLSAEPEAGYRELGEDEWNRFVDNETRRITAAAEIETSLPRVTQINPSIGAEAKTQAMVAIVLSLFAIIGYIWMRFGDIRYGMAAIAALIHDVCITMGAVTACTYIASTQIGQSLLIGDFKINQVIIAAFLTLIGYSLNDTIVVFDRIRENRHRAQLTPETITNSINQTISRTLLTSLTTFIVVLIMYIFGGQALRGFTFAIGLGIIIGTYSSIAIAAPILLLGVKSKKAKRNK